MVLVYGVVEAGLEGWSSSDGARPDRRRLVLLGAFGVIEARVAKAPLIPFKELTKALQAANNIVLLFSAALFPMWFVELAVPAAGARPVAAAHRADLPADDARDHAGRLARRQARRAASACARCSAAAW